MNIKQKICLVSGLILVIVVFLFWGPVKFLILEIRTTSALVQGRNEKLLILEETDQVYLRKLESEYGDIKEDISLVESSFLEADEVVDFFIELENIGFSTFNQLEIDAGNFPLFTLHLVGAFPSLMKFLGWLENGTYFVDVDSVQIRPFSERSRSLEEEEMIPPRDIKSILKIRAYTKD
jgi:hypothetical protein